MATKLDVKYKFGVRTSPEAFRYMNRLLLEMEEADLKFRGRKVSMEAVLNAVILDFLDRPEEARREIVRRNVPRFEGILDGGPGDAAGAVGTTEVKVAHNERKKKGAG